MRTIVLVLLALAGISLTSTDADAGAWCASYRRGVSNCSYSSYEQCRATVSAWGILAAKSVPRNGLRTGAGKLDTPARPALPRSYWTLRRTARRSSTSGVARRAPKAPT